MVKFSTNIFNHWFFVFHGLLIVTEFMCIVYSGINRFRKLNFYARKSLLNLWNWVGVQIIIFKGPKLNRNFYRWSLQRMRTNCGVFFSFFFFIQYPTAVSWESLTFCVFCKEKMTNSYALKSCTRFLGFLQMCKTQNFSGFDFPILTEKREEE
jgi:hypothetical protein